MTSTSKVLLGIVGAAAAGVVIGLLVAPEKGSEIRSKLSEKTNGWFDQVTGLFSGREDGKEENEDISKEMPQGA